VLRSATLLKLLPFLNRFVVLPVDCMGINISSGPNGRVSEPLGNHWEWHAISEEMTPMGMTKEM
jgi:hypothetical protein